MGRERPPGYWQFAGPAAIFTQIASVTPIYAGMTYERLAGRACSGPAPTSPTLAHLLAQPRSSAAGVGLFHAIQAQDPAEQPDAEYPLILTTGRMLYHYHTGTMTRRSEPLNWREPHGTVEINPKDAAAFNLQDEMPGGGTQPPRCGAHPRQGQRPRSAGNGLHGLPLARSPR